jgi:hypothetical protein
MATEFPITLSARDMDTIRRARRIVKLNAADFYTLEKLCLHRLNLRNPVNLDPETMSSDFRVFLTVPEMSLVRHALRHYAATLTVGTPPHDWARDAVCRVHDAMCRLGCPSDCI